MDQLLERLDLLISQQLPEFVRNEYPAFVDFVEGYYRFLQEQDGVHDLLLQADQWTDLDETLDIFIEQYKKQFVTDFPDNIAIDKRRLIKIITEFNDSKGSENSVELFFRTVFDANSEVFHPGERRPVVSFARWVAGFSAKIDNELFTENSPFDLIEQEITIRYREFVPNVGVVVQEIPVLCTHVIGLETPDVYWLGLDTANIDFPEEIRPDPSIESLGLHDSFIYVYLDDVCYGSLTAQLLEYIDDEGDISFRRGDPVRVESGELKAAVRVEKVLDGDIQRVKFLSRGERFPVAVLSGESSYFGEDYMVDNDDYVFDSETTEITRTAIANLVRTNGDSVEGEFSIGFIVPKNGRYLNNSSFVSNNLLQDNDYVQAYSYVIRTGVPFKTWRDLYKKTMHPAGTKVFAELVLENSIPNTFTVESSVVVQFFVADSLTVDDDVAKNIAINMGEPVYFNSFDESYFGEDYMEDNDDYASTVASSYEVITFT